MMNRSRRGAARVSIAWMIVVLIAFFAALAMIFVFDGERTKAQNQRVTAEAARAEAETRYDAQREKVREISEVLGYYDHEVVSAESVPGDATEGMDQFKDGFGIADPSIVDFQIMSRRAVVEFNKKNDEIRNLQQTVATLQAEIEVKSQTLTSTVADKDTEIRSLTQQLNDANQAAATRAAELESEVASVRSTLSDTEGTLTRARAETDTAYRGAREREAEFVTRLENVTRKLEWQREPERPDGKILNVSEELGLAWINLGKKNRLYAGMRFAVVDGRPGDETMKAWCEVLEVNDDMSEVALLDIRDKFDPPTQGDIIYNPIYDPTGLRNAVLSGRFSGTYNENELRAVLEGINIHVQEKLDKTTDYLIVGAELYVDEEGEPYEEPLQPSDLSEYKEAEAMGVRIVPIKLVTDYFRKSQN